MQQRSVPLTGLAFGLFTMCVMGQSPINDTLVVTFPNSVRVGSQTLSAGEYTIRQLSSASNSRLLEFSTNKGTSIQASATSIPALDNNNRNDSSVLLIERGGIGHLHRIWVKGKSYGYEFPVQKESSSTTVASNNGIRLTATYSAPPSVTATPGKESQPEAQVEAPSVAQSPAPTRVDNPSPSPAPVSAVVVQAEPSPLQAQDSTRTATNVETAAQGTPEMPNTALNWLTILLSGLGMISLGWVSLTFIRRF